VIDFNPELPRWFPPPTRRACCAAWWSTESGRRGLRVRIERAHAFLALGRAVPRLRRSRPALPPSPAQRRKRGIPGLHLDGAQRAHRRPRRASADQIIYETAA
jgi:hypothetical protein